MREILTRSADETARAGRLLAEYLRSNDVVVLTGDLGAGKTALTQGVARGLGVEAAVVSPTFNIVVAHRGSITLYHLDLYRLERPDELEDIDFFGTLEAGGVSIVEWGDRFPSALPSDRLDVSLRITGDFERRIEPAGTGPRGRELAEEWLDAWDGHMRGDPA